MAAHPPKRVPLWVCCPSSVPVSQPQSQLGNSPDQKLLLSQLAEADRQWTPRAEPLANGGYRYVYKRRAVEPPLNRETIRTLITNPPSFERERQAIGQLVHALDQVGVQVKLSVSTRAVLPHPAQRGEQGHAGIRQGAQP